MDALLRRVAELEEAVRQKEVLLEGAQAQIAERRRLAEEAEERCLKERNKRVLAEDELKVRVPLINSLFVYLFFYLFTFSSGGGGWEDPKRVGVAPREPWRA